MTSKNNPEVDTPLQRHQVPVIELSAVKFLAEMAARMDMSGADYLTIRFVDDMETVRIMKMEVVPVTGTNSLIH